jgi:bacterioferritin
MKHVEDLAGRILFLEGNPIISELEKLHVGRTVPEMLENDRALEQDAINRYNEAVSVVSALGDNGTKMLLEHILMDEEVHVDYFETQLSQIEQLGLPNYLMTKK